MDIIEVSGPDEIYSDDIIITLSDDTRISIAYPRGHNFDEKTDIRISHGNGWEKVE